MCVQAAKSRTGRGTDYESVAAPKPSAWVAKTVGRRQGRPPQKIESAAAGDDGNAADAKPGGGARDDADAPGRKAEQPTVDSPRAVSTTTPSLTKPAATVTVKSGAGMQVDLVGLVLGERYEIKRAPVRRRHGVVHTATSS